MSSRRTRRARRQPNQANPSAENSPQAARIDALLDPVRKMDLAGIEDERARAIIALLLNLVEAEASQTASLRVRRPSSRIRRRKSGRSRKNEPSEPSSTRFRSTRK